MEIPGGRDPLLKKLTRVSFVVNQTGVMPMKPITVNGVTYPSVVSAWQVEAAEDLLLTTVRWRLRNGWNVDDAFNTPRIPARLRVYGHQ